MLKFGIIINKVPRDLNNWKSVVEQFINMLQKECENNLYEPPFYPVKFQDSLREAENQTWQSADVEEFRKFVAEQPAFTYTRDHIHAIEVNVFNKKIEALNKKIAEMKNLNKEQKEQPKIPVPTT